VVRAGHQLTQLRDTLEKLSAKSVRARQHEHD
jgi:hypothetical protein